MEPQTFERIKSFIESRYGINIGQYKKKQMFRRLDAWLRRSRALTWEEYFQMVREDPEEEDRFRDYLTINVTSFFRDPERWEDLQKSVLPSLLSGLNGSPSREGLKIWSAGCSIGAEPYTLAMLMNRISPRRRHDILATDFDRGALRKARAGGPFTKDDIKHVPEGELKRFFQPDGDLYFVKEQLRKSIRFEEQDLLGSIFERDFDLIVCRNVVIYFTRPIKENLYRKFHRALSQEGILFLGGTEIIPQSRSLGFVNVGGSVYRKLS
jgi:chemotaxis protein methyltransferase CheR